MLVFMPYFIDCIWRPRTAASAELNGRYAEHNGHFHTGEKALHLS